MLSVNITLCRNCVCMMMLTFSFNYTLLEQIVQCIMILMLSLMKIRDNNSSIAQYHPPLSIHKVTDSLIQLAFFVVSCVDRVYVHVKPYIIRLLVRMVPLKILILSLIALKLMFNIRDCLSTRSHIYNVYTIYTDGHIMYYIASCVSYVYDVSHCL